MFESDTDDEESAFLDRELQREVGIKADVDPAAGNVVDVDSDEDGALRVHPLINPALPGWCTSAGGGLAAVW